jgi:type I restriction enzyme S subunit
VRHKTGSRSYAYYAMRSLEDAFAQFEAEGTVFGSISKKDFHNLVYIVPDKKAVREFDRIAAPVDDRIECCEHESRTLAALRDALLPKLVSGELRVRDAERFLRDRGV